MYGLVFSVHWFFVEKLSQDMSKAKVFIIQIPSGCKKHVEGAGMCSHMGFGLRLAKL